MTRHLASVVSHFIHTIYIDKSTKSTKISPGSAGLSFVASKAPSSLVYTCIRDIIMWQILSMTLEIERGGGRGEGNTRTQWDRTHWAHLHTPDPLAVDLLKCTTILWPSSIVRTHRSRMSLWVNPSALRSWALRGAMVPLQFIAQAENWTSFAGIC